jgi:maltose/moltooligosaccharide transporter
VNSGSSPRGATRPELSFWQIWNMCFGFLGLQFAFALQNANVSRIFQTLGATIEQIPALWIAAPLTGLLVQPVIGYFSDRTWTRIGRRRPYLLGGALLATCALVAMPMSASLWVAAVLLWVLDASINVAMEPFRAFVGDQLSPLQRPAGYAMQSFFIGVGAVIASALPYALAALGVSDHVDVGDSLPANARYAFYLGAAVLILAVAWTGLRSREYPPDALRAFADSTPTPADSAPAAPSSRLRGGAWLGAGIALALAIRGFGIDRQLYLLAAGAIAWGLARLALGVRRGGMLATVIADLETMPATMRRLVPVQFFSWLALFSMWIYTTAAVTQVHFGASDPHSHAYNQGADWVGVLFAAYNGCAALAAAVIPAMARRFGMRASHFINLWLGAAALLSFLVIRDPLWLLLSMVGVGFAWASILSLPYALLADSVPAEKMGIYMGIFNFFIVIPQLVAASVLGAMLRFLFGGAPIYAFAVGGVSFALAGLLALRVPQPAPERLH